MNQKMQLSDWKVDNSAGRPILTYKGCSVIEAEDAEFVLGAIKVALGDAPAPSLRDRIVEVLREHHEVKHIGVLADRLEAALSAAEPQPAPSLAVKAWADKIKKLEVSYHVGECIGLADWAAFEAGIAKGLEAAAEKVFALSAQVQDVAKWEPPQDCERKEELAFETWASSQHYDMHEHPLHYLFMDPKTDAARQGWKAALQYVRDDFAAAPERQEGSRHDLAQLEIRLRELISENPEKARMASSREDLRLWFISELISDASGRIPLLEIEGLVARQLAAAKGGEA